MNTIGHLWNLQYWKTKTWFPPAMLGFVILLAGFPLRALQINAVQTQNPTGFITGSVRSSAGPEAGVWVIAETRDLPTKFVKIVVTDDQGRYMVPDLPAATYDVWVRGFGLVDSNPVETKPVTTPVALTAVLAKTPQEAAKVYPGDYWLSLLAPPAKNLFPGTGPAGNGIGPTMTDQNHWINQLKSGCNFCHQLGTQLTRTLDDVYDPKDMPADLRALEKKPATSVAAWDRRLRGGVRGDSMYGTAGTMGTAGTEKVFADWTDRIAAGEVPPAPKRPQGVERNVVVTLWDVGDDHTFMHDIISTDKNHPTVNAGGPIYGVSAGHGQLIILNPKTNTASAINIPTREPAAQVRSRFPAPQSPSLHWGNEHLWSNPPYNPADPHNAMLDSKGRVWTTSKIRQNAPAWCSNTANKYVEWSPARNSARQASYYDPKTQKWNLIETCYSTHHLQFDNDADETLYFNELSGPIFGWVDTKIYDATFDATRDEFKAEQAAVGWCPQIVDTNGDGKITKPWTLAARGGGDINNNLLYNGDTPLGPAGVPSAAPAVPGAAPGAGAAPSTRGGQDTIMSHGLYAVIPSPVDDSVWGVTEDYPGYLLRLQRGNNPPSTCKVEIFRVPEPGFDPRGVDIDKNGVVWTALAASSHLASFDVRKCRDLTGPQKIDGSQCKEGWTLYATKGPKLKGTDVPSDFHYYNWVDQNNIFGFGANTPFVTGSNSDSLIALTDKANDTWTYLRVPYPLGFYSRGMDGRIDDPGAGWKGKGLWSNYGTHFDWHIEGGKGTKGKVVHFQLRPDPLAR